MKALWFVVVVGWIDHGIHIKGRKAHVAFQEPWTWKCKGGKLVLFIAEQYVLSYVYWSFWDCMTLVSLRNCTTSMRRLFEDIDSAPGFLVGIMCCE